MESKKPNFFIIGAAKAGTTSLHQYLKKHPEIYFSPVKEPNYFSTDIKVAHFSPTYRKNTFLDVEEYFRQPQLTHLQLTFVRKAEHYKRLFKDVSQESAIGEASTSYLYSKEAAANIKAYRPDAKIIAVLRNPLKRAFSHYQMALRYGHTHLEFEEAIKQDYSRAQKGWGISELFIELGLYYEQLKRYYEVFPSSQIKVLLFDDLVDNPAAVLNECHQFLGVTKQPPASFDLYNQARIPKHKVINKLATKWGLKNLLKTTLPQNLQEKLKSGFFSTSASRQLSNESLQFMESIYKEDIQKTSRLIGRELTFWLENQQ